MGSEVRSQPCTDHGDVHGGLVADGELVEASGHRPMPLEPVDAAVDGMPGFVVLTVKGRRPTTGAAAGGAVTGLVGRFGDGAFDAASPQVRAVGPGGVRLVAADPVRPSAWTAWTTPGHPDRLQQPDELWAVTPLTGGDDDRQWPLPLLTHQMDFGGQSTTRPAES